MPSKEYKQYEEYCGYYLRPRPETPLNGRLQVKCVFYFNKNIRADLVNYQEAICDILVHYKIIEDDRWQIVYSMDGSHCAVDRENPRVEIEITDLDEPANKEDSQDDKQS